jgi:hypothetical protein
MNRPRVVVMVEGGVVHNIISNVAMEALVLDIDTEGADDDRIKEIIFLGVDGNPRGTSEGCYASTWDVPAVPITVDHYFKQMEGGDESADDGEEGDC